MPESRFPHRTANRIMGSGWVIAPHPIYVFVCDYPLLPPSSPPFLFVLTGSGRCSFFLLGRRSSSSDFSPTIIKLVVCVCVYFKLLVYICIY